MELWHLIRSKREGLGLSKRQLSEKSGVRSGYISIIEQDQQQPVNLSVLEPLADALCIPFDEIWAAACNSVLSRERRKKALNEGIRYGR